MRSSIAIVGVGPRGLSILERLCDAGPTRRNDLTVHLIDPNPAGSGAHYPEQANHLLMNTVAGQVSMFRTGDSATEMPVSGLGLAEWAGVDDNVYLPRSVLGRYLTYPYRRFRRAAANRCTLREHRARATQLRLLHDRSWAIHLSDDSTVRADFVFLTTGHGANHPGPEDERLLRFADDFASTNRRLRHLPTCYPLWQLDTIDPASRVAVRGMGLSAIDVVASLTAGRGGRFVPRRGGGLTYRPSGQEPRLFVYSRSGRVFWPRATNQKAPADTYQGTFLTADVVGALRATHGQLDFDEHVLPLLLADMRAAATSTGTVPEPARIDSVLRPRRLPSHRTLDEYQAAIVDFLAMDEVRAAEGNLRDPVKAATDALRDLRDNLRSAVEHRGLTPESHERFCRVHAPLMDTVAAGPPLSRAQEWRALFESGILRLGSGPAPRVRTDEESGTFVIDGDHRSSPATQCDVIVGAAVDRFMPERDTSSLVRSLLTAGHARGFRNGPFSPGGFDIDTAGRLVGADGTVAPNICAVGHLTEGPHYFTNMLPAPGLDSRVTADAAVAVDAMAEHLLRIEASRGEPVGVGTRGLMQGAMR
ncbi:FAD/NAD(P)-binding protein [Actinophytocola sp.]|uniref:FAD/NAD(P)-binding protein n=1 Tax=Actinophytocola sp. TaxID=1872138 RepID=UPI00389A972C